MNIFDKSIDNYNLFLLMLLLELGFDFFCEKIMRQIVVDVMIGLWRQPSVELVCRIQSVGESSSDRDSHQY